MSEAQATTGDAVEAIRADLSPDGQSRSPGLMRTILRNSAWSTFSAIAGPALQFLFGGLTLRYVGVEATGFSLAVGAALGVVGRFGTCGIGEAALPAIAASMAAGDEHRVRRLIGVVLTVFGVSSIATAAVMNASGGPFLEWSKAPVAASSAATFIGITCLSHVLGQMSLAVMTVLRAAGRYELVTMITTPVTLLAGIIACVMVPLFPSLTTVALIGLASAAGGFLLAFLVAIRAVPELRRPLAGLDELPGLARYGFWLLLTHAFGALTAGVDDLVIAGACGAAAVPPWSIAKRLWLTAHTFLAQHAEHLIPTLGSLRHTSRHSFASVSDAMHWYVVLLAAVGYTLLAWSGEAIVGAVAGSPVAALCQPPIFAYSLLGIGYAVLVIPVIAALAEGASRPAFVVALLSNAAQIAAIYALATSLGAPAVYYAPVAALPVLLLASGTTSTSLFDARSAWSQLRSVALPLGFGNLAVLASLWAPNGLAGGQRIILGGIVAIAVFLTTIGLERFFSINISFHRQLARALQHAVDRVAGLFSSLNRKQSTHQSEQVAP